VPAVPSAPASAASFASLHANALAPVINSAVIAAQRARSFHTEFTIAVRLSLAEPPALSAIDVPRATRAAKDGHPHFAYPRGYVKCIKRLLLLAPLLA
jgi:hypothetical protein